MYRFKHWSFVASMLTLLAISQPVMAQGKGRGGGGKGQQGVKYGAGQPNTQQIQQTIQRLSQQLQEGEKEFKDAAEKANEARAEWQKIDTEHKKNIREVSQARKAAEEEAKNDPELKAARQKTDELRKELTEVRKAVAAQLAKDNEEYQAALKEQADAVAEQKSAAGADLDTRRSLARKVSEADKKVRTIEDVALVDHSDAKRINASLKEEMVAMAAIVKRNAEAVDSDQRLSSAKVAFMRTKDELKAATGVRDQAEGMANRIRSIMIGMARERASLEAQQQQMQRMQQGQQGQQGGNRGGRR